MHELSDQMWINFLHFGLLLLFFLFSASYLIILLYRPYSDDAFVFFMKLIAQSAIIIGKLVDLQTWSSPRFSAHMIGMLFRIRQQMFSLLLSIAKTSFKYYGQQVPPWLDRSKISVQSCQNCSQSGLFYLHRQHNVSIQLDNVVQNIILEKWLNKFQFAQPQKVQSKVQLQHQIRLRNIVVLWHAYPQNISTYQKLAKQVPHIKLLYATDNQLSQIQKRNRGNLTIYFVNKTDNQIERIQFFQTSTSQINIYNFITFYQYSYLQKITSFKYFSLMFQTYNTLQQILVLSYSNTANGHHSLTLFRDITFNNKFIVPWNDNSHYMKNMKFASYFKQGKKPILYFYKINKTVNAYIKKYMLQEVIQRSQIQRFIQDCRNEKWPDFSISQNFQQSKLVEKTKIKKLNTQQFLKQIQKPQKITVIIFISEEHSQQAKEFIKLQSYYQSNKNLRFFKVDYTRNQVHIRGIRGFPSLHIWDLKGIRHQFDSRLQFQFMQNFLVQKILSQQQL